jgi:xanthine dehydrogenase YagS FAD-binding subunit
VKRCSYLTAETLEAAARVLSDRGEGAVAKSGGTDLLDLLKERILQPDDVVNLLRVRSESGEGRVSALTTLAELAADDWIGKNFPAVAHAAGEAATPQIRNVGTVGGNLCQHTRCWFFRNPAFDCYKRGQGDCSAAEEGAHNRYHAIFPHDRRMSAHPSNLAPALIAVGAKVE